MVIWDAKLLSILVNYVSRLTDRTTIPLPVRPIGDISSHGRVPADIPQAVRRGPAVLLPRAEDRKTPKGLPISSLVGRDFL